MAQSSSFKMNAPALPLVLLPVVLLLAASCTRTTAAPGPPTPMRKLTGAGGMPACQARKASLTTQLSELQATLDATNAALDAANDKITEKDAQISSIQADLERRSAELAACAAESSECTAQLSAAAGCLGQLNTTQVDLQRCSDQLVQLRAQFQAASMGYAAQVSQCGSSLAGCTSALNQCQQG